MASAQDLLNMYARPVGAGSVAPTPVVSPVSPQVPTAQEAYRAAAATDAGINLTNENQIAGDIQTLEPYQLHQKYGSAATDLIRAASRGNAAYAADRYAYRNEGQAIDDAAGGVLQGGALGVGTIGALGLGLVNDDAGVWASQKLQEAVEWDQGNQSAALNTRRRASAARSEVLQERNARQAEVDEGTDGAFMAGLKRVGRDAIDSMVNAASDSTMLSDGMANAVGSMAVGGVVGKALKVAGAGAAAMPAAIGLQEGSGAYQQTVNQVMGMSHEQLLVGSPEYSELIRRGMSAEEAKVEIATDAGMKAAAIQGPVGAATGMLVSKFEANPFKVPSLGSAVGNLAREGVEEGIQSGAGQVAQNYAIQSTADQDQDLLAGVGDQVGQGALYGIGAAGVTQAPGVALRTAVSAAKLTARGTVAAGKAVANPILARADSFLAANEASSPVSREKMDAAMDTAAATALDPSSRDEIKAAVATATSKLDDTAKQDVQAKVDQVFDAVKFDPAEADLQAFPVIGDTIRDSSSKFDAFRRVADLVTAKDASPQDKIAGGMYLLDNLTTFDALSGQLFEAISAVEDEDPSLGQLRDFEAVADNIQRHPQIRAAIIQAKQLIDDLNQEALAEHLSDENIDTPEGKQVVNTAIGIAQFMPDKLSQAMSQKILGLVESKRLAVTQTQLSALKASSALVQEGVAHQERQEAIGLRQSDIVSKQILTDEKNDKSPEKSASEHFTQILGAVHAGSTSVAAESLLDFRKFAQHMQNKVQAFNQSLANGDMKPVPFQALNAESRKFFKTDGVFLNPKSTRSVQLAQQTAVEAVTLANMVNHLIDALPGLGVERVEPVALSQTMMRPAREVEVEYRKGRVQETEVPSAPVAEETQKPIENVKTEEVAPEKVHDLRGEKISPEWTRFSDDSGTLNIPRAEMPQVAADNRGALIKFLGSRGITGTKETMVAANLKPTQDEFSEAKVRRAKQNGKSERSILVSSDGHILDGHHQWVAAVDHGEDVNVIRFSAPIKQLVEAVREMPSAFTRDGATEAETKPETTTAPREDAPRASETAVVEENSAPPRETKTAKDDGEEVSRSESDETADAEVFGETGAAKANTIESAYPNLIDNPEGGIENKFLKAFSLPKEIKSRLLGTKEPLAWVREQMAKSDDIKARMSRPLAEAYDELLNAVPAITAEINDRLEHLFKKDLKPDSNTWLEGKVLNLVERNAEGKLVYNQELAENAALAGLQWFLLRSRPTRVYDQEMVAKIEGVGIHEVNDDVLKAYQNGVSVADAKRALAQTITRFWGLKERSDQPLGFTKGIPEAMAIEILKGLEQQKLIEFYTAPAANGQIQNRIRRVEATKNSELLNTVAAFPAMLETLALTEPEVVTHIGQAPTKVAQFQMNNELVENTAKDIESLTNQQNTPYKINKLVYDFYTDLDKNMFLDLFGEGDLDERPDLNVNHLKALKSKNLTWSAAFDRIQELYAETENLAKASDTEVSEMPIHFEFNIASNGRAMMQGPHNPQASKATREVVLPTRATLDLTDAQHMDAFMVAIAQHLGVKVHKKSRDASIKEISGLLNNELIDVVDLFQVWHSKNGTKKPLGLNRADIEMIKDRFDAAGLGKPTPAAIHSIIDFARYQNTDQAGRESFSTSLYLEADGVTDGPINSLIHMTSGEFTAEWVSKIAKGGAYFGKARRSFNSYVQSNEPGANVDLYETTTIALKKVLADFVAGITDTGVSNQYDNLATVLADFLSDDYGINAKGELEIERGAAKNPLTVTIYGSGKDGIAAKVTQALVDAFYERLSSNDLETDTGSALNTLFTSQVRKSKEKGLFLKSMGNETITGEGVKQTLTKEAVANLHENVKHLFVNQLVGAIDATIGETQDATSAIVKATNIQSLIWKDAFQQKVLAKLAEKKKAGIRRSDFLSQDELDAIYGEIKHLAPYVSTGSQTFLIGKSANADIGIRDSSGKKRSVEFSRSVEERLGTPAYVHGPDAAGVSGTPTMVIGTGDGRMMQLTFTGANAVEGGMQVFDGLNMKLTTIEQDSETVNRAVHTGWTGAPPYRAIFETFRDFVAKNDLTGMSDELRMELTQALLGRQHKNAASEADLLAAINAQLGKMETISRSIQARRNVLAKVNMSVDHMASAESPFVKDDGLEITGSPEEIAAQFNKLYAEELAKLTPKAEVKTLDAALVSLGSQDASGASVIKIGNLRNKIRQISKFLKADDLELLRRAVNSKQVAGYRMVVGTPSQTQEYLESIGYDNVGAVGGVTEYEGLTLPDAKLIIINNGTAETLLHELVHASTMEMVLAHAEDASSLSQVEAEAVDRLYGLMDEWLDLVDTPTADVDFKSMLDMGMARDQIIGTMYDSQFTPTVGKALALNEFMSWVLSNDELKAQAASIKVSNPLVQLARNVFKALKQLVFGKRYSSAAVVGDDLLSNVRFNTAVLMKGKPSLRINLANLAQFQAAGFGNNERLTALRKTFVTKIGMLIKDQPNGDDRALVKGRVQVAIKRAFEVSQQIVDNGFPMNMQELSTFRALVQTFTSEVALDPNAMVRIQDIYAHVTKQLSTESFMVNPEVDEPNDRRQAERKFNSLMGVNTATRDELGRTTLLASFLALANVDESFRQVLSKIEVPKALKVEGKNADEYLTNAGRSSMTRLARLVSGENRNSANVKEVLDSLTRVLADNTNDQQLYIDQFVAPVGGAIDKMNQWWVDQANRLGNLAGDKLDDLDERTTNKAAKGVLKFGSLLAGIVSEDRADLNQLGLIATANKLKLAAPMHDFLNEMVGRTGENKNIFDMIKRVSAASQQIRQQFREEKPKFIAAQFSRKLTDQEWAHLFKGLAKTDLPALGSGRPLAATVAMLQDLTQLRGQISNTEEKLQEDQGNNWPLIQKKAKQLAHFMNTGEVGPNLLRNAEAVARLIGEVPSSKVRITQRTIAAVDELVSLYALDGLSQETKDTLSTLAQEEPAGMKYVYAQLEGRRKDELSKVQSERARINHFKGHATTENEADLSLKVMDGSEHARLLEMGYTMVGQYEGSPADRDRNRLSYYFSPVSGKARFNQGIMQNVRASAFGVDPVTGFTTGSMTAGRITDPKMVKWIDQSSGRDNGANPLMPIYSASGQVVAFERSVDPRQLDRLNEKQHLAEVLGIWQGRQIEELKSAAFNRELVDELGAVWDDGRKMGRTSEFIDLLDPKLKDPVMADAVALLTPETKDYIKQIFGDDGFMVRRDMINDAVGYRAASVGDIWSGTTRLPPQAKETARKLALGIFGADAYKWMVQAESTVQGFVGDAKQTIVVRSVIVPVANLVSNAIQLMANGVPIKNIVQGMPRRASEIDAYLRGRLRRIELESDLGAARDDLVKTRQIKTEIYSIEDGFKRLSIWPLIQAGEFNSISEASIDHDATLLTSGKLGAYMEKLVNKLPDNVRNAGRYAYLTKDTALFQGLQKTVEYGDFLAKAVLYEDLIKRKGMNQDEALAFISEEFVHYDRLSGRVMDTLDNLGLAWFWKFKVRSVKVAFRSIRRNPLHVLMASMFPTPDFIGSVGLPVKDNLLSITAEGGLHWSMGPGMGISSFRLNPLVNLAT